ncbi:hypothetical protein FPSE_04395 [Fusarium pseudograminearum CS3096]|uniref:Uncharacterized protein n=1 Tax=Fusarium pseudograminearum (strain CS3096) TaxID=1028729 RepID=K3VKR4_FUSPC|nr:hypothetical protein FPSE_04395 [Fusarium pseudograminearum CS3096]EKJ75442.1 hypothetical protein FPSE_04395 [Fusarium pseudograminearum CS3096]
MDPFQQLPPEVRLEIMSHIHSHTTLWRLTQASPAMWNQCVVSKPALLKGFVSSLAQVDNNNQDLIQDLIQDAMAIIRFNESMGNREETLFLFDRWLVKSLPTFETNADITKLHRLFVRTSFFIEDYMTKATSPSPTEAYRSLPNITFSKTLNNRVTLDDLTLSEKYRLFRAFFKFEVITKIYDPRLKASMDAKYYRENARDLLKELDPWVHEAVLCVYGYVEASYGAIFAQLGKKYGATSFVATTAMVKPLLFPDNLYFSAHAHFDDIYLPKHCPCVSWWLSCHGMDLLAHVLIQTRQTSQNPDYLLSWLYSISLEVVAPLKTFYYDNRRNLLAHRPVYLSKLFAHTDNLLVDHLSQIDDTQEDDNDSDDDSVSGDFGYMSEEELQTPIQLQIYRQRAWVLCDNWRLYPIPLYEHFPSPEDIDQQQTEVVRRYPLTCLRERQRRRSTEWQTFWEGRNLLSPPERAPIHWWAIQFVEDNIYDIPHFYESAFRDGLSTFWRVKKAKKVHTYVDYAWRLSRK